MKTIAKIELKANGSGKKRLLDTMETFNGNPTEHERERRRKQQEEWLLPTNDALFETIYEVK